MRHGIIAVVVGVGALVAGIAHADPLLLTSGTISAVPQGGVRTRVDFLGRGDGLALTRTALFDLEAQPLACERSDCTPGSVVGAGVALHPIGFAAGMVHGVVYPDRPSASPGLLVAADLLFSSEDIRLPELTTGTFSATVPFTLTGHLLGYSVTGTDRNLILDTFIEGRGLAELNLDVVARGGAQFFVNPSIRYALEPASPAAVPEPGTWVLSAGGLFATLLLVSRARRSA